MSGRPWWASDAPGDGRDRRRTGERADDGAAGHRHRGDADPDLCRVCPICATLRALDDVRPELVEHLSEAARHLALAAKAFLEAQATRDAEEDAGLERIDLDE